MNKKTFERVTKWQRETFPQATALSKCHHLIEEVRELQEECEKSKGETSIELTEELADCFILLLGIADSAGFEYQDLGLLINCKMTINEQRKWGKADENGVVKHVKSDNTDKP
jgi:NTP pyrophosphatase (non-canonical NTP hydrolase)